MTALVMVHDASMDTGRNEIRITITSIISIISINIGL